MIEMHKIRQLFKHISIADPAGATLAALQNGHLPVVSGSKIAVAVGSRGIHAVDRITRSVIDFLKSCGAQPFIIPAMGSHGGATPQGQREVLAGYGITEATMGVPVDAAMDVDRLESPGCECAVYMSCSALHADGIIMINRIKPHTDYHDRYESGLVKMSVIGLGKHAQALEIHNYGVRGLKELLPVAARHVFATGKILAGVAIVENRLDLPLHIEVLPGHSIMQEEPRLLHLAAANMPRLPVENIDVLIVDYIGKDFSGTGLDTNIIGRMRIRGEPEPASPSIKSIYVRDLSERSHGNALGIGMAEVISRWLFNKIDFAVMYGNSFTSTFLERVKVPVIAESDAEAVAFALRSCGNVPAGAERIVRIKNTLQLDEMYVSGPVMGELSGWSTVEAVAPAAPLLRGPELCCF